MTRTDETEVILGTLVANTAGQVTDDHDKSPLYTDTEVTENERTVKFWNRVICSDTDTNGKERMFKVKIAIVGHGIDTECAWVEHEYTSPLAATDLFPEKTISVPDQSLNQYDFAISLSWEFYEKQSGEYVRLANAIQGPETATVNDNSSGS